MPDRDPPRVLVMLAEGAEEMEATITVDVLRRGGIDVVLAGIDGDGPVACSRGVRLLPDAALDAVVDVGDAATGHAAADFDLVVLPGGLGGTEALAASATVGSVLRAQVAAGRPIAAICAAPMALAQHGIAAGRPMTCHPSVREVVAAHGEWTGERVVETEQLITSQGPGTAFEFALALVARLAGAEVAESLRGPMILPGADV